MWVRVRRALHVSLLAVLVACGGGGGDAPPDGGDAGMAIDSGAPDAGADAFVPPVTVTDPAPTPPTPPTAPAPPAWTCPAGWRDVAVGDDPSACEPWPEGGHQDCAAHEAHLPGTPGCQLVGDPCPAGAFPPVSDLPADRALLYVEEGAAGGTGSRTEPFGTIAAALGMASPGTTIVLGAGRYDAQIVLPSGVDLLGVCVERAVLATSATGGAVVRVGTGAAHTVENLHIDGGPFSGVQVRGASTLTLRGVVMDGTTGAALNVSEGSTVTASDIVIRDTVPASDMRFGRGVSAHQSTLDLGRALVVGSHDYGVVAVGGTLDVRETAILGTMPSAQSGSGGSGLLVASGAVASVDALVLEQNHQAGLLTDDPETRLTGSSLVVRETEPLANGLGYGIAAVGGSSISIAGALVERNRSAGLAAFEPNTSVSASDVLVRDTRPDIGANMMAVGLLSKDGGHVEVTRGAVIRPQGRGALAETNGASMTLTDVTIADVPELSEASFSGRGLVVFATGTAEVTRLEVRGAFEAGVYVGDGATLVGADVAIADVRASQRLPSGRGFNVELTGEATVDRLLVEDTEAAGVLVYGSMLGLRDARIARTRAATGAEGDVGGVALELTTGTTATLERVSIEDAVSATLFADGEGTAVGAAHLSVTGTAPFDGRGFQISRGATLSAETVVVVGVGGVGMLVSEGASATLTNAAIRGVRPDANLAVGRGVSVQGSQLFLTQAAVEDVKEAGLYASDADLSLIDVVVRDVAPQVSDGAYGRGLSLGGSTVTADGLWVASVHGMGIYMSDVGFTGQSLAVTDVAPRGCAATTCSDAPRGMGIGVYGTSEATLSGFVVLRAALCGLHVAEGGNLTASDGRVSGSEIGACVSVPDLDLGQLTDSVLYVGNGANLDSTTLPVPEPMEGVEGIGATAP